MSYICGVCKEIQGHGERPTTVVVETREREYVNETPEGNLESTTGWEVVKEVKMCTPCLELWDAHSAEPQQ